MSSTIICFVFFFFKQKTAYEITYGDWSSDVCSSDLGFAAVRASGYSAALIRREYSAWLSEINRYGICVPQRVETRPLPRCAAIRALKQKKALIGTIGSCCINVALVLRVNRQGRNSPRT